MAFNVFLGKMMLDGGRCEQLCFAHDGNNFCRCALQLVIVESALARASAEQRRRKNYRGTRRAQHRSRDACSQCSVAAPRVGEFKAGRLRGGLTTDQNRSRLTFPILFKIGAYNDPPQNHALNRGLCAASRTSYSYVSSPSFCCLQSPLALPSRRTGKPCPRKRRSLSLGKLSIIGT